MNEKSETTQRVARAGRYLLIGLVLALLATHLFRWNKIDVDGITLALLGILLIIPLSDSLSEISIPGLFSAKIKSEEVQEAKEKAARASKTIDGNGNPAPNVVNQQMEELASSSLTRRYWWLQNMVRQDPQVGLANVLGQLQFSIEALYRVASSKLEAPKTRAPERMIDFLCRHEVLPLALAESVRSLLRLANRAAHGERVERGDAEDLAIAAVSVLMELDMLYHERVVTPVESKVISRKR
jgi:hypothetical protein